MENDGAIISIYGIKEKLDRFWGGPNDEFGVRHVKWRFMCRYVRKVGYCRVQYTVTRMNL